MQSATPCPNDHGPNGCKCPDGYGLKEYARDHELLDVGLPETQPVRLRVVTADDRTVQCDRTMTCTCEFCLRHRPSAPAPRARQPWEPRPPRARAA